VNGATVADATDEQPAMVVPPRVNVTAPATLVVATMVAGEAVVEPGNVPFAPLNTMVGVVVAAEADATPNVMKLPRARDPTTIIDMILFMVNLLLLG
jgi:hypothetical protein